MTDTPDDLSALFSFLDDDGITLPPVKSAKYPAGKVYVIPSPDADTGIRLNALGEIMAKQLKGIKISEADAARLNLNDEDERVFLQQVLGPTYDEMREDGVSWVRIKRLGTYAFTYFAVSPEAADKAAREGAFSGKGLAPRNRAARRAPAPKATSSDKPAPRTRKAPRASAGS